MQGNLTVKQIADSPQRAMKEQHKIGKFGPEKRKLLHLPEFSLKDKKTSVPEVISRVGTEKKNAVTSPQPGYFDTKTVTL